MRTPFRRAAAAILSVSSFSSALLAASSAAAWTARSTEDEGLSTHLWIVDRAVDLLARRTDLAEATRIAGILNDATCRAQWQQALWDADHLAVYDDGVADIPPNATLVE